jgi:RNA polymerase sigma-70 factor (ECF subfamily)
VEASRAAELAARQSYGKLLAWLTARCGDPAAAEDALAEAFLAALADWPLRGVPRQPEAWLLVTARRRWLDGHRRRRLHERLLPLLVGEEGAMPAEPVAGSGEPALIPDDRLRLLFLCAHPAIASSIQAPLMLQTVLGLDAARIAAAFLVAPATMGQRLVRAKAKIRLARIPFVLPPAAALPGRVAAVHQAIYAAYGCGWEAAVGEASTAVGAGLAEEAVLLARLCAELLPDEPESLGLLALLLHAQARQAARRDARGTYVPLQQQDTRLWSAPLGEEAEATLRRAATLGRPGRFQLEAAIQSVHAQRAVSGVTDWPALLRLYEGLNRIAPSVGARLGHAAALAEVQGAAAGLALLDALAGEAPVQQHQPWWALRAHLLARAGRRDEAATAYGQSIELATDPAVARFLEERAREAAG